MIRLGASSQTHFKKESGPAKRPIPEISDSLALIMSWGLLTISGVSWITVAFNPEYEKTALVINAILLSTMVLFLGAPSLLGKIQGKPLRGKKFFSYLLLSLHLFISFVFLMDL